MGDRSFRVYPEAVYLLFHEYGDRQSYRFYTNSTFALKARDSNGVVFEMPMPPLESLKVVGG